MTRAGRVPTRLVGGGEIADHAEKRIAGSAAGWGCFLVACFFARVVSFKTATALADSWQIVD